LRSWGSEKKGDQALGRSKGGLTTKIHMLGGSPDIGMYFELSPGQTSDVKIGKEIINSYHFPESVTDLVMDKGYSTYEIVELCRAVNIEAVVPPKQNFKKPWSYNKNIYMFRNEIERLFHRIKNFRRVATRYDKLKVTYSGFIFLGLIALLVKILC